MSNNILDQIQASKRDEVALNKKNTPTRQLEQSAYFERACLSYTQQLNEGHHKRGVIAEFKRKSPSRPKLGSDKSILSVAHQYQEAGASAMSILTDATYFGGSSQDLQTCREISIPILRKDFIVDEYQIIEAKSIGADIILLIAEILDARAIKEFVSLAHSLGMQVLLEMHHRDQCKKIPYEVDLIGINNRDLTTFKTDIRTSLTIINELPQEIMKITESGILDAKTAAELWQAGYRGYLIGEYFLNQEEPGLACQNFIREVNEYLS